MALLEAADENVNPHPAPLPENPTVPDIEDCMLPPKLDLSGMRYREGIKLTWNMTDIPLTDITEYELYYYEEDGRPPHVSLWERRDLLQHMHDPTTFHVPLVRGRVCYFAVRAVDSSGRYGPFSNRLRVILNDTGECCIRFLSY